MDAINNKTPKTQLVIADIHVAFVGNDKRNELLAFACYLGSLDGAWRGVYVIYGFIKKI
jgi:hypothetical protein